MKTKSILFRCVLSGLFLLTVFCPALTAQIIYVDDDAAGANDGSSWENAYVYLQDALADANDSVKHALSLSNGPVEIRVAQGVYKPDQGAGQTHGDRNATFQLINGVTLAGGYAGIDADDPLVSAKLQDEAGNARDFELYETILSGDLSGNDIDVNKPDDLYREPTLAENSYHVITGNYTNESAVLDGFTISNGNANGTARNGTKKGGGVYILSGSPTLTCCTFIENSAYHGGGLCNDVNSNVVISNCTFKFNCAASKGAGIHVYDSNIVIENTLFTFHDSVSVFSESSNPIVINCVFEQNNDGAVFIREGDLHITGSIFRDNIAYTGAGICSYNVFFRIEDCVFKHNKAVYSGARCPNHSGCGGALYCGDSLSGSIIKSCLFYENTAGSGAGAYLGDNVLSLPTSNPGRDEEVLVIDCSFMRNNSSYGGAIYQILYTVNIENTIFCGNSASESGGAIYNICGNTNLKNCFFGGNRADSLGAVVYNQGFLFDDYPADYFYDLNLNNCTIVDNIALYGRTISCRSDGSAELDSVQISNCVICNNDNEIYNPDGSQITIDYTNFPGGLSAINDPCNAVLWGMHNIDVDPLFADHGYWADINDPNIAVEPNNPYAVWVEGDYHLKSQAGRYDPNSGSWIMDDMTSPCIDAGDPNSSIGDEPEPNGGIINMGVYGGTPEASLSTQQSFPRLGKASNPNPPDGAFGIHPDVIISWSPGKDAVSHDVYFGLGQTLQFIRNQTETDFNPGQLYSQGLLPTQAQCCWRIDEIDSQGNTIHGDIWEFQVHEYKGRLCFTGNTPVLVDEKFIPISKVSAGQGIGYNLGKIETVQTHEGVFTLYDISLESGNFITVAENHFFMTESRKWISLHELKAGTSLKTSEGSVGIASIKKRPELYKGKVYNLKIEGSDQYMVGEDAIIVRDY